VLVFPCPLLLLLLCGSSLQATCPLQTPSLQLNLLAHKCGGEFIISIRPDCSPGHLFTHHMKSFDNFLALALFCPPTRATKRPPRDAGRTSSPRPTSVQLKRGRPEHQVRMSASGGALEWACLFAGHASYWCTLDLRHQHNANWNIGPPPRRAGRLFSARRPPLAPPLVQRTKFVSNLNQINLQPPRLVASGPLQQDRLVLVPIEWAQIVCKLLASLGPQNVQPGAFGWPAGGLFQASSGPSSADFRPPAWEVVCFPAPPAFWSRDKISPLAPRCMGRPQHPGPGS